LQRRIFNAIPFPARKLAAGYAERQRCKGAKQKKLLQRSKEAELQRELYEYADNGLTQAG
jgi:hypothetical protein